MELATFKERPERIVIDPRPSSTNLYYITCSKEYNQGYLTCYNTHTLKHSLVDSITLSTDILLFTTDCTSLLGVQRYPVNFVSIAPDTLELQRSICYHNYCPLDGLPLRFPLAVDAYLESGLARGLQAPLVVSAHSRLSGLVVPTDSCVVLIPVLEKSGNGVAIVHLNMADTGLMPTVTRVDLYSLGGKNQLTFADDPMRNRTDHNHNLHVPGLDAVRRGCHQLTRGNKVGPAIASNGVDQDEPDQDSKEIKSPPSSAVNDEMWMGGTNNEDGDSSVPARFRKPHLQGLRSNHC